MVGHVEFELTWLLVIGLVYFDDCAIWVLQEDLIPASDGPNAVVGELNVLFSQHCLECLYVIGAKRNVAAIERIEALFGSECYAEVLRAM